MADQIIQLPADSTGKKVDVSELTVGANTVERQRINLADPTNATSIAAVKAASAPAAAADPALVVSFAGANSASRIGDGTNNVAVKAGSTAPLQADGSLVVSHSPNVVGCTFFLCNAQGATVGTVKGVAGALMGLSLLNNNAAVVFVEFFDTSGTVTLGTTLPAFIVVMPASSVVNLPPGIFGLHGFTAAIKIAAVTTYNGTTGGSVTGSIMYL